MTVGAAVRPSGSRMRHQMEVRVMATMMDQWVWWKVESCRAKMESQWRC